MRKDAWELKRAPRPFLSNFCEFDFSRRHRKGWKGWGKKAWILIGSRQVLEDSLSSELLWVSRIHETRQKLRLHSPLSHEESVHSPSGLRNSIYEQVVATYKLPTAKVLRNYGLVPHGVYIITLGIMQPKLNQTMLDSPIYSHDYSGRPKSDISAAIVSRNERHRGKCFE